MRIFLEKFFETPSSIKYFKLEEIRLHDIVVLFISEYFRKHGNFVNQLENFYFHLLSPHVFWYYYGLWKIRSLTSYLESPSAPT